MKKFLFFSMICSAMVNYCYNKKHLQVMQDKLKNGEALILSNIDMRGADLKKLHFRSSQISGALFSTPTKKSDVAGIVSVPGQQTKLSGANFSKCRLISTCFAGADLTDADLTGADVLYADFSNADLTGAKFDGAINLDNAILSGATMPDGTKCTNKLPYSNSLSSHVWTQGKMVIPCHCPTKKK